MTFSLETQHFDDFDKKMMTIALELAKQAEAKGEVPVGCVLVDKERNILAKTYNLRESLQSPLGHAEMSAVHKSATSLKSWRLLDCTLYVTLEPCFMCAGALIHARIKRVVFGAQDPKAGAMVSLAQLGRDPRLNHQIEVCGGLLAEESSQLLKKFFKARRKK